MHKRSFSNTTIRFYNGPEDVVIRSVIPNEIDLDTVNSVPIKVTGDHLFNAENFQFFKQSGEGTGLNTLQTIELNKNDEMVQLRITTPESMVGIGRYQLRAMDTHSHDVVRCPMPFFIQ